MSFHSLVIALGMVSLTAATATAVNASAPDTEPPQQLGTPYLGAVPMFTELRINSDHGKPEWNFTVNPKLRDALERVVRNLAGEVSKRNMLGAGPELTIS